MMTNNRSWIFLKMNEESNQVRHDEEGGDPKPLKVCYKLVPKIQRSAAQQYDKYFQIITQTNQFQSLRPSISCVGKLGTRFRNMLALPFTRRIAILWLKCLMASDSSWPVCLARADPNLLTKDTVWSCQPPRVSNGRGRKTMPANLHASPCLVIFSPYLLTRAWPRCCGCPINQCWLEWVNHRLGLRPSPLLPARVQAGLNCCCEDGIPEVIVSAESHPLVTTWNLFPKGSPHKQKRK